MRNKYRTHPILEVILLLIALLGVTTGDSFADEQSKPANGGFCSEPSVAGLDAVREFADNVLKYGRDVYGPKHTPLFVDGLHAKSLEPVRWKGRGRTWVLSNFASQQPLLRTLDGLTALTGQKEYRKAAEDATRYALKYLRTPNGLLYWGGHFAWDLEQERAVGQYADVHELKGHQPYYSLMWRVDAPATRQLMEMIWAAHILDWSLLDYNRHASVKKRLRPLWDHEFKEDIEVPFPAEGGNLSFVNVTPPLMHSAVCLAVLDKNTDVLTWTRRLVYRWQQGRHPHTGLCGGQLSYRKHDRAADALGHVHPNINEAKIVASYHQVSRYHHLPLAQMQAALTLMAAGGKYADLGRELVDWASEDLKVYAEHSYDPNTGRFVALMTDGTPIKWRQSRKGYYVPESFAPRPPEGFLLWGYAMAYRLTADKVHWRMVRQICRQIGLGDIGQPDGSERALHFATTHNNWRTIYALLELYRATDDRVLLKLGCRIADNILTMQTKTGLFPRPGRIWARTGDEIPLALLHLTAAINGKSSSLPPAVFDSRFFHCEYHGELEEHQKKRDDKRTYDDLVFYGGS
jgi:pectate lyase